MVANLNGVIFDQIYGDNSGGAEFDTDADGTATQEDEFVSFTNTTGAPVDISGWQVWSDATGSGAPDPVMDGLYHTFPPGTVLQPGETLYIINEITGTPPAWAQEATAGGAESGGGPPSTNFLSEGHNTPESIALVDPVSGDYIVFNMDSLPPQVHLLPGFTGTNNIGTIDGNAATPDMNAGSSYQYDSGGDTYVYSAVFVPCFAAGSMIRTPDGPKPVESLRIGDLVETLDHGPQPVRLILKRRADFGACASEASRPILFQPGALGPGRPNAPLAVSPQHRVLVTRPGGATALVPAKALLARPGVRVMRGVRAIRYCHLVFDRHEVVFANGIEAESYFGGTFARQRIGPKTMLALDRIGADFGATARPCLGAAVFQRGG